VTTKRHVGAEREEKEMSDNEMILDYDPNEYETKGVLVAIPADAYECMVKSVEMKQTKDETGSYLKVTLVVTDGEYKGRLLFDNLNVRNKSEQAQKIGREALNGLLAAAEIPGERDMTQLVQRTVMAKVIVEKSEAYGEQNKVKGYLAPSSGVKTTTTTAAAPSTKKAPVFMANKK
jgi:hypothetical protein